GKGMPGLGAIIGSTVDSRKRGVVDEGDSIGGFQPIDPKWRTGVVEHLVSARGFQNVGIDVIGKDHTDRRGCPEEVHLRVDSRAEGLPAGYETAITEGSLK